MASIDTLTIRGYKSIRDLDTLELKQLNILIGANGSGKSNFVSFFQMLRELVEERLQVWISKHGGAGRIASHGVKMTNKIDFSIRFGSNGYDLSLEPTADDGLTFSSERLYFNGPYYGVTQPNLGSGHNESCLKKEVVSGQSKNVASYCYEAISSWKIFHFHDTSDTAEVKRIGSLHDNEYLRSNASNLAAYLYRLKLEHSNVYSKILKTIRLVLPYFDEFILKPKKISSGEEQISLMWKRKDSDYPFWPSQLSDGSIRFICLTTALLQPESPTTIIIDEPELGLHPYAISVLGSLIRSASKDIQIIISTQSVPLLNEFSIGDLIIVEAENGSSSFKRLDEENFRQWLENYSIGELWEKSILGGRPTR